MTAEERRLSREVTRLQAVLAAIGQALVDAQVAVDAKHDQLQQAMQLGAAERAKRQAVQSAVGQFIARMSNVEAEFIPVQIVLQDLESVLPPTT